MKYVADTNVISELMKPHPSDNVIDWFQDNEGMVYIAATTIDELYYGMLLLSDGRRKNQLRTAITGIVMDCSNKTLPFDGYSAYLCAELKTNARAQGRATSTEDAMIAAVALRNDAIVATRNTKDFECLDVACINPFEYDGRSHVR